ncbi:MAG: hypothetical protein A2992_04190 [Elusimicrobia bacterium RIFCSPLOWO2_01_FULL_59_12]|nr:MAG: hypothetical protein A2992_04190 [Elusimicrobia bacterium RIFCSPLOWO2_01_FULL_59_12]
MRHLMIKDRVKIRRPRGEFVQIHDQFLLESLAAASETDVRQGVFQPGRRAVVKADGQRIPESFLILQQSETGGHLQLRLTDQKADPVKLSGEFRLIGACVLPHQDRSLAGGGRARRRGSGGQEA